MVLPPGTHRFSPWLTCTWQGRERVSLVAESIDEALGFCKKTDAEKSIKMKMISDILQPSHLEQWKPSSYMYEGQCILRSGYMRQSHGLKAQVTKNIILSHSFKGSHTSKFIYFVFVKRLDITTGTVPGSEPRCCQKNFLTLNFLGTVINNSTLSQVIKGSWAFSIFVHMYFLKLKKPGTAKLLLDDGEHWPALWSISTHYTHTARAVFTVLQGFYIKSASLTLCRLKPLFQTESRAVTGAPSTLKQHESTRNADFPSYAAAKL